MCGGKGGSYREACSKVGLNTIQEGLDEADMVSMYRILKGRDKKDKRPGPGPGPRRSRSREDEVRRTLATQRKAVRKTNFP